MTPKAALITVIALAGISLLVYLSWGDYSLGSRSGHLQKFSRRGIFRYSHEGELALRGVKATAKGAMQSTWAFSVEDQEEDVIRQLEELPPGVEVKLHYREILVYNPFRYASGYRVFRVEVVKGE